MEAQRDEWVEEGRFHPGISRYDQLHSDLVDTFARRGVLGLLSLMALYGVPLGLFGVIGAGVGMSKPGPWRCEVCWLSRGLSGLG